MKSLVSSSVLQAIALYILGALAVIAVLYGLIVGLRLIPPQSLTIAAGAPGSAYYAIAERYRDILAEDGLVLEIEHTAGSAENRDLMNNPGSGVDLALIQGGIPTQNPELQALAAIFPEPLLIFARSAAQLSGNPYEWAEKRIALGAEGSGTRAIVDQLATITGAPALLPSNPNATDLSGQAAAEALLDAQIDLAFFVAPLDAPYLSALYDHEGILLLPLSHSKALTHRIPEAQLVELNTGAIRYHPAYPSEQVPLVTLVTKLVARDDLHPALVNRLVHAMVRVHSERGLLHMEPNFPNTQLLDMPADVYAAKLLREGFSALESFLPYWVAAQVNRFAILLLPIVFLLLPLAKVVPALLAWRMQSRVYQYYDRLHEIDLILSGKLGEEPAGEERRALGAELDAIEASLRDESLPSKYREQAYIATEHVGFVRRKL